MISLPAEKYFIETQLRMDFAVATFIQRYKFLPAQ